MGTVLISYQLTKAETAPEYGPLIEAIKSMGPWAKVLGSVWLVDSALDARGARDQLIPTLLSENDRLLVIDVSRDPSAWRALPEEIAQWIQQHL